MREIESYLVRIYNRDADSLVGLVEDVRTNRRAPFQSLAELCEVLGRRKPFARRTSQRAAAAPSAPAGQGR